MPPRMKDTVFTKAKHSCSIIKSL